VPSASAGSFRAFKGPPLQTLKIVLFLNPHPDNMFPLFIKEIKSFFNSLTGYLVIITFLLINSLFMWVFDGPMNLPDGGYATIDTLFILAPWVFLMLIPAVTMRSFAEERRTGTIDLLLMRPLSGFKVITAKYYAATFLILLALLPTLIYYYSIVALKSGRQH
jgi:ABC-2 type transport system permease protein